MASQLTVLAPLVIVSDESGSRHHVYQGAPVPAFVTGDQKKRLSDDGLIGDLEVAEDDSKSNAAKKTASSK